jgi:hypothetical protein
MTTFVNLYARAYVGHIDVTNSDKVAFGNITAVKVPFTNFGSGGFVENKPGLISGEFSVDAFQDFAADVMDDELGVSALGAQYPISVQPNPTGTETAGDAAWFTRGIITRYDPLGGAKGDAAKALTGAVYDTAVIRGLCAHPKAARTSDGNGTAVALVGPTASQRLYAAIHVTAYSGFSSVVFKIQSDDAGGFGSATDRITLATVTGTTSEFASVAGSFSSETHHRVTWDVTGSGSVTFACFVGVL